MRRRVEIIGLREAKEHDMVLRSPTAHSFNHNLNKKQSIFVVYSQFYRFLSSASLKAYIWGGENALMWTAQIVISVSYNVQKH